MAMVHKVKLKIGGMEYAISTDAAEGYIQELAAQLDTDIRNLMHSDDRISLTAATVMTALMRADDAQKATETADNLRMQMKEYLDDSSRYRQAADSSRREIDRLRRELDELKKKCAANGIHV